LLKLKLTMSGTLMFIDKKTILSLILLIIFAFSYSDKSLSKSLDQFCNPDSIFFNSFEINNGAGLAFPGAVGFGRYAGVCQPDKSVYYVTNLNDSGVGSLRDALSSSNRYVLFKVSGTITLSSQISSIANNIHIAGQTAFVNGGQGITIRSDGDHNSGLISFSGDHIVMRYLRLRRGKGLDNEVSGDNLNLFGSYWMVDHSSFSWSTDENISSSSGSKGTMQYSISSEGLYFASHAVSTDPNNSVYQQGHSKGSIFGFTGGTVDELSFYRNLFAHNDGRNPRIFAPGGTVEIVNNLLYNNRYFQIEVSSEGSPMHSNIVKNLLVQGSDNRAVRYMVHTTPDVINMIYMRGNIGIHRTNDTQSEWREVGQYGNPIDETGRSFVPFESPLKASFETLPNASELESIVLADVGASLNPDAVDTRVLNDVLNRTPTTEKMVTGIDPQTWLGTAFYYGIINDPEEVGGWPVLSPMSSVVVDQDMDGMEDQWEILQYGTLNTNTNDDTDLDGLSNIDEYLQSLIE